MNRAQKAVVGMMMVGFMMAGIAFAQSPQEPLEEVITIETFFPAPWAEFDEMRLYPTTREAGYCDNDRIGYMYYDDNGTGVTQDDDAVKVCKGTVLGWQKLGGLWTASDNDIYNTNTGNVGIGTATPQGSQDSRTIQLDVAENIIAKDIYLDNPNSGSPRWVSEMGIGIISLQTSTLLLNSISNNTTFQDVISLTINIVGSNILVFVDCGWARAGGSYQSILSQRIVRGTDIIDFATLGGAEWSGAMDTLIRGGGNYLFTGLSPGNHTINYQVKTNAFTDKWTINNARMILISW